MRATVIAAAVGAALIAVSAGADAKPANSRVRTDIPPEALGTALRSLAQEFGSGINDPVLDALSPLKHVDASPHRCCSFTGATIPWCLTSRAR